MSQYGGRPQTTRKLAMQALSQLEGDVSASTVLDKMIELGWDANIGNPRQSVLACLSRMYRDGQVDRPDPGRYRYIAPPPVRPVTREAAIANLHDAVETVLTMSAPRTSRVRVTIDITED